MGIQFNEKELQVIGIATHFRANRGSAAPIFNTPISMRENWRRMVAEKKPLWLNTGVEMFNFYPDIIPDNRARGFVNDGGIKLSDEEKGGKDMFGIEWVYVPVAGGSMEKPGAPHLFEDANEFEKHIIWTDIESWDWEGCSQRNKAFLDNGEFNYLTMLNGFGFERLVSFMGFENAAMALVDEEQRDALHALFDKTSDLYCAIIDKSCQYFDIDGFIIHDDWGSQRAPFFSFDVGRELLVPYMKKVVDCIHGHNKVAELHSCGCNERQIENFIAAGWDIWGPMASINDTQMLFEKYGDKIILGVYPDPYDIEKDSDEVIRAKAREFVKKVCSDPKKVCILNRNFSPYLRGVYAEELYKASRIMYENN